MAVFAKSHPNPHIRLYMLVGLAVDNKKAAMKTLVESSLDADFGIRKCACYLLEKCSGKYFGPIGNIQIASTVEEVDFAGKAIREYYAEVISN